MKKEIFLFILLLFSSSMLAIIKSSADTTRYDTKEEVGFTGVWEKPNSSKQETYESDEKLNNNFHIYLPKTGELGHSSVILSCVGFIISTYIAVYSKRIWR
ncbi:hypothetical protein CYU10_000002 [Lactococcus lactis subsp. lactis]|uniref:Cell surface protein n=1 Tax=Lactococcus lactis subsp. lactis TaxID=1360 RepID=A0A2N5WAB3_LACLL|nr:hypothetical protein CYU10_000002 [Lactococcus lactis subsp. lactis]